MTRHWHILARTLQCIHLFKVLRDPHESKVLQHEKKNVDCFHIFGLKHLSSCQELKRVMEVFTYQSKSEIV